MRYLLAAIPAVLLFAACGSDSNKTIDSAQTAKPEPTLTEQQKKDIALNGTPTPVDKPLPTPQPVTEDGVAVQVIGATGEPFMPKVSEFKQLATQEISAGGQKYTGVTLASLLAKVPAGANTAVTIDGVRADGNKHGSIRFPIASVADTTVLVMDDKGRLNLASSSIPKEQWLIWVTGISIR